MSDTLTLKFLTESDKYIFCLQENITPENDLLEVDISKVRISARRKKVSRVKDLEKSKKASKQWRTKKHSLMKGIKKFHKSTKGKRFHRKLGRLIATRNIRSKNEWLVAANSLLTHLHIQSSYTSSFEEDAQIELLVEDASVRIHEFCMHILEAQNSDSDIDLEKFPDTLDFFSSLVDPEADLSENDTDNGEGD